MESSSIEKLDSSATAHHKADPLSEFLIARAKRPFRVLAGIFRGLSRAPSIATYEPDNIDRRTKQ